ncbi:EscU/YscU/HrcU family type III secretion system export apparatus switch protein [Novosphingobium terrae]|uniref:EscU/YscU/HrcU family type III secretion system export apparatus switch protein n=1 Tax=Novosphingobium terrae TaxID=2726189 RepID=UPI00197D10CA|nr:EscU/YscU/HrcU family type III secretion system export apparatus switch protein [Novosphingobium terrae]
MAETAGEKTQEPTDKRLKDSAEGGDVLRSRELAVAATALVAAAFMKAFGPWLLSGMTNAMRMGLVWNRADLEDFRPGLLILKLGAAVVVPVIVLAVMVIAATLFVQLGMAGKYGRFVASNLMPKGSRLDPIKGMSKVFGPQGWIEVGKGLLKLALLGTIAWFWGKSRIEGLQELADVGLAGQLNFAWEAITSLMLQLSVGFVIIAMFDWPVQWLRRRNRLRMSLQEVKDEHKEQEGSPEARAHRRRRQRQIAMGAIGAAMRKAEFVVTNPTHFSVALVYDPEIAPAPVVVVKGKGEKALAIRELAAERAIPCLEFPGLARALYYTTRDNQMIREELYVAVAGVLGFVMSLKRGEQRDAPIVDVPVELRFDTDGRPQPDEPEEE